MCQEALDMERSNGEERTESKCRKDKDYDLRYGTGPPAELGEFPCAVCCTGVGSNSIFCNGCKHWVHKKCSGLKRLKKDPDYRCTQCKGFARPLDGRPQKEVQVGLDKLEVVASFCYLGDMLSAAGGCELSTPTCVTSFWRREDSNGMDMWNAPMVQSKPLTYRLMESMGLGGPRWHGNSWQRGIAESRSSQPSTLMIYLQIWCEICHARSKPAISKGAHWCGCCPCTCTLIKNLIMIWWYDGCELFEFVVYQYLSPWRCSFSTVLILCIHSLFVSL